MVTMTVSMVITGDNHLNYYSQKLGSKLRERRRQIGRAWRKTIDFAIEKEVDLYLNVGDLFDQISPRNPPRARVVEAFVDLQKAGIRSLVISGTHDSPATMAEGACPHSILKEAGLATVFEETNRFGQEILKIGDTTISIAGISTNRRLHSDMDPLENITIPGGGDFNIAMLHYSTERIAPPIWEEPMIRLSSLERNKQIDLFAMGHIHKHITQKVGDSLILYPGATEHFDFGEADNDTGFCYVVLEGDEIKVDYVKTESQPMTQLKLHTSKLSAENPTETILDAVHSRSDSTGLFQLVLEGEMPFEDYLKIDFTRVFDEGRQRNFYYEYLDKIKPIAEGIEFVPSRGLHPRNELLSMANKAVERAPAKEKALWKRALELALSFYDICAET